MKIFKNSMIGAVTLALAFIATPASADNHAVNTEGEVSFGFGLNSSAGSLAEWGNELTIDYWLSGDMAIGGGLAVNHMGMSQGDVSTSETNIGLNVGVTYVLAAGEKTRLTAGGGIAVGVAMTDDGNDDTDEGMPIEFALPVGLSIEHFVSDTVSIGVNHSMALFAIAMDDDGNDDTDDASTTWINIDTTEVGLELTWYTD